MVYGTLTTTTTTTTTLSCFIIRRSNFICGCYRLLKSSFGFHAVIEHIHADVVAVFRQINDEDKAQRSKLNKHVSPSHISAVYRPTRVWRYAHCRHLCTVLWTTPLQQRSRPSEFLHRCKIILYLATEA